MASAPLNCACYALGHLRRAHAENKDVVLADVLADLDISAVERADGDGAIERKLHIAGAGGFHAGGGNLLGQVGGRNDRLGKAHTVVRREHELQPVADRPGRH